MTSTPSRRAFRYAVALVLAQVVVSIACFIVVTRPWFLDTRIWPFYRVSGYAVRARGMNCQVVAYGDSTGLSDLIPSEIEARTGLKTCNVAEFRTIGDFMGNAFALDQYLAHNAPPRFIVAGFNPDNFYLNHPRMRSTHPADFAYAARFDRGPWLWKGMVRHPGSTASFLVWIENMLVSDVMQPKLNPPPTPGDDRDRRDHSAGYWARQHAPETHCTGSPNVFAESTFAQNQAGVAWFRQRYTTPTTSVLVLATPVAACVPATGHLAEITQGLSDLPLEILPISAFNDQDIHLDRPAAVLYSRQVADKLLSIMQAQGEKAGR